MTADERKEALRRRQADLCEQQGKVKAALATAETGTDCPGGRHYYHTISGIPHDVPHKEELVALLGYTPEAWVWGGYFEQCLGCGKRFARRGGGGVPVELPPHIARDIMWGG